ncbi:MAG: chorismate synthase [Treponema sp.]|nr:MAG: chorismate synthase [Treponema sp.]
MFANSIGSKFRVTSFGESRGVALGVVIDGCPAGLALSENDIQAELNIRMAQGEFETERREPDKCQILSGVFEGKTLGTPISVVVYNKENSAKDYEQLKNVFRPGHADYGWHKKFSVRDYRGGGRSSGRETVSRVIAGAVAKKILEKHNIKIKAYSKEIAGVKLSGNADLDFKQNEELKSKLNKAKEEGNSLGGIIACEIKGVPAGIGEPVFSKLDAELAKAIISIGGIKGIEFGAGFELAKMTGSTSNDIEKNNNGGIIGGISDGNIICFNAVVKPVPSIKQTQKAYNAKGEIINLSITGRHDVCIVRRILPVVEAMSAIVLADFIL